MILALPGFIGLSVAADSLDLVSSSASLASEPARLAAARVGDRDAFAALMAEHLAALYTHCCRLLGSLHDADDAMQDVQLLTLARSGRV